MSHTLSDDVKTAYEVRGLLPAAFFDVLVNVLGRHGAKDSTQLLDPMSLLNLTGGGLARHDFYGVAVEQFGDRSIVTGNYAAFLRKSAGWCSGDRRGLSA